MKTYVLDASALFVFLKDQSGAGTVTRLLEEGIRGRARILMSVVNYGEVYGLFRRRYGPEQARAAILAVYPLPIAVLDATTQRAFQAADIKAKFKLYYVDSFAAALAIEHKATLVTSDSDFRKLGHTFPVLWLKK